jgi:hypothetical protein
LKVCRSLTKSWVDLNNWWACSFSSAANLRYIMVR